ncbi:hypothetical protein BGX29_005480 [Mortierella sp. GBA35]|nr:hypothetical protein BGX29_005480 [Mortierella sp. GBA35]
MYHGGFGVSRVYSAVISWYLKAAAKGNSISQRFIGMLYSDGNGVQQDYVRAREGYPKASRQGDSDAMFRIGLLYEKGSQGVDQDETLVLEWFRRAADKGFELAREKLSSMKRKRPVTQQSEDGGATAMKRKGPDTQQPEDDGETLLKSNKKTVAKEE